MQKKRLFVFSCTLPYIIGFRSDNSSSFVTVLKISDDDARSLVSSYSEAEHGEVYYQLWFDYSWIPFSKEDFEGAKEVVVSDPEVDFRAGDLILIPTYRGHFLLRVESQIEDLFPLCV